MSARRRPRLPCCSTTLTELAVGPRFWTAARPEVLRPRTGGGCKAMQLPQHSGRVKVTAAWADQLNPVGASTSDEVLGKLLRIDLLRHGRCPDGCTAAADHSICHASSGHARWAVGLRRSSTNGHLRGASSTSHWYRLVPKAGRVLRGVPMARRPRRDGRLPSRVVVRPAPPAAPTECPGRSVLLRWPGSGGRRDQ